MHVNDNNSKMSDGAGGCELKYIPIKQRLFRLILSFCPLSKLSIVHIMLFYNIYILL